MTRDSAIEIARELGFELEAKPLELDDLLNADGAVTGTAAEITPIREVDGEPIGGGTRGPVTEQIQTTFFRCGQWARCEIREMASSGRGGGSSLMSERTINNPRAEIDEIDGELLRLWN